MASTRRARITLLAMLAGCAIFFYLVIHFLGPDVFKARSENALWFMLHIVGGSLVLALGPFQFIAPLRNRYRRYHRIAGYLYVAGSLLAFVGIVALLPPKVNLLFPSQALALVLWMTFVLLAIRAIRTGKVLSHQHHMARSFVLAAYFLTVRVLDRHGMWLLEGIVDSPDARLAHSDWLAWVLPLMIVEIYFSLRWESRLQRRREER